MDHLGIPENAHEYTLGTALRHDVESAGGHIAFLQKQISSHLEEGNESDPYRANVLQLQRLAQAVAAPQGSVFEITGRANASAFYWGSIIGMELGARVLEGDWSASLYTGISKVYNDATRLWDSNQEPMEGHESDQDAIAAFTPIQRRVALANMILGKLEADDETVPMDNEYATLCDEFTTALGLEGQKKRYAELGYLMVIDPYTEHVNEIIEAKESEAYEEYLDSQADTLAEAIDNITEWSTLEYNDEP